MSFFNNRAKEPSTWGGLALLVTGVTSVLGFGQRKAEIGVDVATQIGEAVSGGLPWWMGAILAGGGIAQTIGKDRGAPDRSE